MVRAVDGAGTLRTGVVLEFDEARGLGVVSDDDERRFGFHCTAVADGTRNIDVGTRVVFVVEPGHLGVLEAASLFRLDRR